jgi:hypothetical protein
LFTPVYPLIFNGYHVTITSEREENLPSVIQGTLDNLRMRLYLVFIKGSTRLAAPEAAPCTTAQ